MGLAAPWIIKKAPKSTEIFSKNQNFRNSPGFKKIKIFAFLEFQNFWLFDFFLDDGKIFFTRNFFNFWIGRPEHVRVGRWRVGFLSVTASESQKYRKRFKIPQNHKTKKMLIEGVPRYNSNLYIFCIYSSIYKIYIVIYTAVFT